MTVVSDGLPKLRSPVLVAAFTGWNDAADAATRAVTHLAEHWGSRRVAALDPDPYYDYQMARPNIRIGSKGLERVDWPAVNVDVASPPEVDRDVVLLAGAEPSLHWHSFCREVAEVCHSLRVERAVILGALLADIGYTGSLPVSGVSHDPQTAERLKLETVDYEGPGGLAALMHGVFENERLPTTTCWVHVPHYAAAPPCPKGTLTLLHRVEEALDLPVPAGALVEQAAEWENDITQLVESDSDIAEYVEKLQSKQPEDAEPSAEDIAEDFERYLRRRGPRGTSET